MEKKPFMNSFVIEEDMQDICRRNDVWQRLRHRTVLITGAAGMLASYAVFFLLYLNEFHGADIHIVAQVRNGEKARRRFGKYVQKEYFSLVRHDLCEPWTWDGDLDYIIHAAGLASPQYYATVPVEVAEPNAIGTYYLLQLAREKAVKGFLFFSSGDVYGKFCTPVEEIREEDFGSLNPLELHSCYGESKRMAETWCRLFFVEHGVPAKIARIAHTYAPTMDVVNDPRVFSSFMKCVQKGEDIVMHSDGSACRPFCYIADATAAFFLVLLQGKAGEAYNVANDEAFLSIYELAELMVGLRPELGLNVICEKRKNGDYLEDKVNHANRPVSDKLRMLGWQCRYDAREGFGRVWRCLQEGYGERVLQLQNF